MGPKYLNIAVPGISTCLLTWSRGASIYQFFQDLLFDRNIFKNLFEKYSSDGKRITLPEFQRFLKEEQDDPEADNKEKVSQKILSYLQDPSRHVQEPYFYDKEFLDWLFSKDNQVIRD